VGPEEVHPFFDKNKLNLEGGQKKHQLQKACFRDGLELRMPSLAVAASFLNRSESTAK
jgi:hypothetical protein